jgi:hypothetical protein
MLKHQQSQQQPLFRGFSSELLIYTNRSTEASQLNSSMANRIYLDKIVSNPHFPRSYENANLPLTMPDIGAAGIKSKFAPSEVEISYPGGRLTQQFKEKCREQARTLERPRLKLETKEKGFNMAHRNFMDNVLCDLEDSQKKVIARNQRRIDKLKYSLRASNSEYQFSRADVADNLSTNSLTRFGSSMGVSSSLKSFKTYGTSSSTRQKKPYSRMSLFNSLLETTEPPKDKRRFAQIGRSLVSEGVFDSCEGSVIYSHSQERTQEPEPVPTLDDAAYSQPLDAQSATGIELIRRDDENIDKIDSENVYGYEGDEDQFDAIDHGEELQPVETGDTISAAPATTDAAP